MPKTFDVRPYVCAGLQNILILSTLGWRRREEVSRISLARIVYAIVRSGKWRGPYIMDYLNCKQLKNAISCTWWCQNWWFQTKNVPWFVLDINKGAILPSDSGSLLHYNPSEKSAYVIYYSIEPGNQGLVSNSLHLVNIFIN